MIARSRSPTGTRVFPVNEAHAGGTVNRMFSPTAVRSVRVELGAE
jgi:hypothetical protein